MQDIAEQEAYKELNRRLQKAVKNIQFIRDSKWLMNHDNPKVRDNVVDGIDQALDDALDALKGK